VGGRLEHLTPLVAQRGRRSLEDDLRSDRGQPRQLHRQQQRASGGADLFNAGPEPVRNARITFSGHLERASWDTRTYRDLAGRVVSIYQVRLDEEDMEEINAVKTGADGRYRSLARQPPEASTAPAP
jgi:hypothetical protein